MPDPTFDPYFEWLGISPHERPINHYRLLDLPLFVSDAAKIRAAADAKMQHVRTFQSGRRADHSQKLLNEIAAAKTCLLDADTKATYDAVLQGQLASTAAAPPHRASSVPPTPPPIPPAPAPSKSTIATSPPPVAPAPSPPTSESELPPFYHAPWFPVAAIVGVVLLGLGVFVIVISLSKPETEVAEQPPVETTPSDNPADDSEPPPVYDPADEAVLILQEADGTVQLSPATAVLEGNPQLAAREGGDVILDIRSTDDRLHWRFRIEKPGPFRIEGTYAAPAASAGGEFTLQTDDTETKTLTTRDTGGPANFTSERIGFIWLKRSGEHRISLVPEQISADQSLMTLRMLRLVPVNGN